MIPEHWRRAALGPPHGHGGPLAVGALRSAPEDFSVEEILGFAASGSGPHALLRVRKRGANTEWVARELARALGCKPFEVGVAGLKDRNAVATQYFSVPRGARAAESLVGLAGEGFEVLEAVAHQRKLPRGALAGNRFEIVVRGFGVDGGALRERIASISAGGVPNYFGAQRFGREAGNLAEVMRRSVTRTGGDARGRAPRDDGFMLSAARSLIFNAVLARRVEQGSWNRLLPGDIANLDARGSVFAVPVPDDTLAARCAAFEIHPTGPLCGAEEARTGGAVRELEDSVAETFPEALSVIRAADMRGERRALRMRVRDLEHEMDRGVLRLRFMLGAGCFATTVLREIIAGEADGD